MDSGRSKIPAFFRRSKIKGRFSFKKTSKGDLIELPDSRPMPSIGKSRHELRINDQNKTWRIIYFIDDDAIVILEVFAKKTPKTPQKVIDVCKQRLAHYKHY